MTTCLALTGANWLPDAEAPGRNWAVRTPVRRALNDAVAHD